MPKKNNSKKQIQGKNEDLTPRGWSPATYGVGVWGVGEGGRKYNPTKLIVSR